MDTVLELVDKIDDKTIISLHKDEYYSWDYPALIELLK